MYNIINAESVDSIQSNSTTLSCKPAVLTSNNTRPCLKVRTSSLTVGNRLAVSKSAFAAWCEDVREINNKFRRGIQPTRNINEYLLDQHAVNAAVDWFTDMKMTPAELGLDKLQEQEV